MEWTAGKKFNFPEHNCEECGAKGCYYKGSGNGKSSSYSNGKFVINVEADVTLEKEKSNADCPEKIPIFTSRIYGMCENDKWQLAIPG